MRVQPVARWPVSSGLISRAGQPGQPDSDLADLTRRPNSPVALRAPRAAVGGRTLSAPSSAATPLSPPPSSHPSTRVLALEIHFRRWEQGTGVALSVYIYMWCVIYYIYMLLDDGGSTPSFTEVNSTYGPGEGPAFFARAARVHLPVGDRYPDSAGPRPRSALRNTRNAPRRLILAGLRECPIKFSRNRRRRTAAVTRDNRRLNVRRRGVSKNTCCGAIP